MDFRLSTSRETDCTTWVFPSDRMFYWYRKNRKLNFSKSELFWVDKKSLIFSAKIKVKVVVLKMDLNRSQIMFTCLHFLFTGRTFSSG